MALTFGANLHLSSLQSQKMRRRRLRCSRAGRVARRCTIAPSTGCSRRPPDIVGGSGRYSTSRGVLGTVQGVGGSLSNGAAGILTVAFGYDAAFAVLAAVAVLACGLVFLMPRPEEIKRLVRVSSE